MKCPIMAIVLAIIAAPLATSSYAESDEDWREFFACAKDHNYAAEKAEPSLFDGARLIVDVLCKSEAADLANKIAARPELRVHREDVGYARAFEDGLAVIRREVTADLYFIRRNR